MKILIADRLPAETAEDLSREGFEVEYAPSLTPDDLEAALTTVDALVVRSTRVTAEAIRGASHLQLIVRAGAGYDTIDVAAASEAAIYVANCPGQNAVAVAELAIGLIIALDRRVADASSELHAGHWNKAEYGGADGLLGKTLGVVGVGRIGREVIGRAQAFGLEVVGWSRSLTMEQADAMGIEHAASLIDLARRSDIVSVHLAANHQTRGILGEEFLGALPDRAMLVNTSRGGIVDEDALLEFLESGAVRYGTDVYSDEPSAKQTDWEHPVANHPATLCTPHIGASTRQAQLAVAAEAVRVLTTFHQSGRVPNCVNLRARSQSRWRLNVRHLNEVGVLASVLTAIREAGVNVEDLENVIFEGIVAACARMRLSQEPSEALVRRIQELPRVIDAERVAVSEP